MSDRYQHSRLLEPDAFRLIILGPSSEITAPLDIVIITGKLSHYENDVLDCYIALSYVWGDQSDTCMVDIEGNKLEITASLELALRHLRDASRTMKVWADSICINQIDNEEKDIQIRLMGKIYGLARSTMIFLGEATPECHLVLDALHSSTIEVGDKESVGRNTRRPDLLAIAEEHILQRPWFTRVWVLQELVLSLDPWIQIGTRRVRWSTFTRLLDTGRTSQTGDGLQHLSSMNEARFSFQLPMAGDGTVSAYSTRLFSILISRRGAGVSDPKDMIWGHLGIVGTNSLSAKLSAEFEKFVGKAYEKSMSDLYAGVALYLIKFGGGCRVLSHKEDVALQDSRPSLPSWAPDWTSFHSAIDVGSSQDIQYCELRHLAIEVPGRPENSLLLACAGMKVSVIDKIVEDIPPSYFEEFLDAAYSWDVTDGENVGILMRSVYHEIYLRLWQWLGQNSLKYFPPVPEEVEFLEALDRNMNRDLQTVGEANGLYEFVWRFWKSRRDSKGKKHLLVCCKPQGGYIVIMVTCDRTITNTEDFIGEIHWSDG